MIGCLPGNPFSRSEQTARSMAQQKRGRFVKVAGDGKLEGFMARLRIPAKRLFYGRYRAPGCYQRNINRCQLAFKVNT
jgi:hypothetical protein